MATVEKYYQYTAGFDNIRSGFKKYRQLSIFVSKPIEIDSPGQVSLKTNETRPAGLVGSITIQSNPTSTSDFYHGSLEYEIVKENFDENGNFACIDRFPVLPLGISRVLHERFDPVEKVDGSTKNNVGFLRFFDTGDVDDLIGYKNGNQMTKEIDWTIETSLNQIDPEDDEAMVRAVKILSPKITDIYTFSYTPKLSNTVELPRDLTSSIDVISLGRNGKIRMSRDNIIYTDTDLGVCKIAKSNLYLIIKLRRNSALSNLTPSVEDYLFSTSSGTPVKFE